MFFFQIWNWQSFPTPYILRFEASFKKATQDVWTRIYCFVCNLLNALCFCVLMQLIVTLFCIALKLWVLVLYLHLFLKITMAIFAAIQAKWIEALIYPFSKIIREGHTVYYVTNVTSKYCQVPIMYFLYAFCSMPEKFSHGRNPFWA